MVEYGIVALALANPAVAALIGTRLTALLVDKPVVYPAVSYQRISSVEEYTLDGPLGLERIRLQVDCWGETYKQAKSVAAALRALLNGYAGTLPNGVVVEAVERDSEHDGYDQGQRAFYVQTDWLISAAT